MIGKGQCFDHPAEVRSKIACFFDSKPLAKFLQQKSSVRVKVEHSIGGLKRYRFLSDRLRCRNIQLYNIAAGICAGLWNFCLTD